MCQVSRVFPACLRSIEQTEYGVSKKKVILGTNAYEKLDNSIVVLDAMISKYTFPHTIFIVDSGTKVSQHTFIT